MQDSPPPIDQIKVASHFQGSGRKWQRRRRVRIAVRTILGLLVVGLCLTSWMLRSKESGVSEQQIASSDQSPAALVQSETTARSEILVADAAVFLDIRTTPMILDIPESGLGGVRRIALDHTLDANRAPVGSTLVFIRDTLLDANQWVHLTIPSTSADLAAIQTRCASGLKAAAAPPQTDTLSEVEAGHRVEIKNGEGSWGMSLGGTTDAEPLSVAYLETVIENTISETLALPNNLRRPLFKDHIFRLEEDRPVQELLKELELDDGEITRIQRTLSLKETDLELSSGRLNQLLKDDLVALRLDPSRLGAKLLQVSFYSTDQYLISLAQPAPGRFQTSDDPWYSSNLLDRTNRALQARGSDGRIRLKDAIYTALLRNDMDSQTVGETMLMLSRAIDLDQLTGERDQVLLLHNADNSLLPSARLLFIGLEQPGRNFQCYVVPKADPNGGFGCFDPQTNRSQPQGIGSGFNVPVEGIKTSDFGPRFHPILKKHVNHSGIDWAAPTGTPVYATAAGEVSRAGVSASYGNIIYLKHAGGLESRYAHLDGFAAELKKGDSVSSGQIIGYVGTTGRSTGPHLHFEMRSNGTPVDPLNFSATRSSGSVEALVNRIIKVESAGNARAKNRRSSATGLGQFISSTWIRMMKTYRPDLANSLTRAELLELRFDPTLSRAMVTNLARENEAVISSAGLPITPGRLCLAHFLGARGAVIALQADPAATVLDTMGAAVVKANPFLSQWTNSDLEAWAERKLSGLGSTTSTTGPTSRPDEVPPTVRRYQEAINSLLESL